MTLLTVLVCNTATFDSCTQANALHYWTKETSPRGCTWFANMLDRLDGNVGEKLRGPFQYQMKPGERVKVLCTPEQLPALPAK